MKKRLLLDMDVSPVTADGLRRFGHDVVTVAEALHPTAVDEDICVHAGSVGRTVITRDKRLLGAYRLLGWHRPSVILIRGKEYAPTWIAARIHEAVGEFGPELSAGAIVVITLNGTRVRRLPLGDSGRPDAVQEPRAAYTFRPVFA